MQNLDLKTIYQWPLPAQFIVIGLMVVTILIFGYFFDLRPYSEQIQISQQQEEDLKRQLISLIEQQATIKIAVDQLPVLKKKLQTWQQNIITSEELPALLDQILNLGKASQLNILSFKPERESKDGVYYKVPVSIDVVGTYDQIARYVSELANMKQFVAIDALFVYDETPNDNGSGGQFNSLVSNDLLTAEVDLEIYRR